MKKEIAGILSSLLLFMPIHVQGVLNPNPMSIPIETGLNLNLDGVYVQPLDGSGMPVECFITNETTYVPLRFISESFDLDVEWDGPAQTVYISGDPQLKAPDPVDPVFSGMKSSWITVYWNIHLNLNGRQVTPTTGTGRALDVFLWDSTTYVPIRFISEYYGLDVDWNDALKTVFITTPEEVEEEPKNENEVLKQLLVEGSQWDVGSVEKTENSSYMMYNCTFRENGSLTTKLGSFEDIPQTTKYLIWNKPGEESVKTENGNIVYRANITFSALRFLLIGIDEKDLTVPISLEIQPDGKQTLTINWKDSPAERFGFSSSNPITVMHPKGWISSRRNM